MSVIVYLCLYLSVCMCIFICLCVYIYIYVFLCVWLICLCACVSLCVRVCVCLCAWYSLEGVHSQCYVHPGAVGQEDSQGSLLEQSEDQDAVPMVTRRHMSQRCTHNIPGTVHKLHYGPDYAHTTYILHIHPSPTPPTYCVFVHPGT